MCAFSQAGLSDIVVIDQSTRTDPIRRRYNQWANNETLEDCALRFTALKRRRWSCLQVASTALGSISFLALEAIGAAVTLQYGWVNASWAIVVVSTLIFILSVPIAYHAANAGVDVDLLTRGAGFGYLGSTITSLIYAGFTFIYFALEAAIMATALQVCFSIPLSIGYLVSSLAIIPAVVYGITMISRVQRMTQHAWLILQIAPFVFLAWQSISPMEGWQGLGIPAMDETQSFDWLMFGAASAVVFSLTVQIGEQVDYLRFLPPKTSSNCQQWWIALLGAGPGWILIGAAKMFAGAYLCLLAIGQGLSIDDAVDPVHMYINVWASWLTPELALAITGIFVIICQFKINITNSYAGSIAWSNFFSRLTHSHPGRVVWLVFNVTIAWMLMELGVYASLESTLSLYSILGVSWIGAIAADLTINKRLGLSPPGISFKRAELYDINPVGVGAMAFSTGLGLVAYSGVWGPEAKSMATYITLTIVLLLVPLLAWLTKGIYYLARKPNRETERPIDEACTSQCVLCRNEYDAEDLIYCPAHEGTICSLCCSLDTRCEDLCRPDAPFLAQLRTWTRRIMPDRASSQTQWLVLQFLCLVLLAAAVMAFIFGLVYLQTGTAATEHSEELTSFIQKLFCALLILAAIVVWMFLLASESAHRAREDTLRQNRLLQAEIHAHELTEKALHSAREKAEAANEAKSRYVIGLSHELRTPLNSILGYAQLMEQDIDLPDRRRNGVRVIRDSSQHLAGLIENLLDISRIEANRLTIHRDRVNLHEFVEQLVQMFEIQARSTGLQFRVNVSSHVPERVIADQKRLRQILINLLSNAFKYTRAGHVELNVDYRSQVTTFSVSDSGPGIDEANLERIYQPFETLDSNDLHTSKGTGLGLTISKLLARIMGGDLVVSSVVGQGSCFVLKLLLSPMVDQSVLNEAPAQPCGKLLVQRCVAVVDDDENHRSLITEFLEPLGFRVRPFSNATQCLNDESLDVIDVFLLDISMPGMNGWALADKLRQVCKAPVRILMISALADDQILHHAHDSSSRNYFIKPLDLNKLMTRLREILELDFVSQPTLPDKQQLCSQDETQAHVGRVSLMPLNSATDAWQEPTPAITSYKQKNTAFSDFPVAFHASLQSLYAIGHITAICDLLKVVRSEHPQTEQLATKALQLLQQHQLEAFADLLKLSGKPK